MGSGGGTNYSQGVTYTSDMPVWMEPAHMELARWATEAARLRPFPSYQTADGVPIPRIAGFDEYQIAAFEGTENLYQRGQPETAMAWNAYTDAMNAIGRGQNVIDESYTPGAFTPGGVSSGYVPTNLFDPTDITLNATVGNPIYNRIAAGGGYTVPVNPYSFGPVTHAFGGPTNLDPFFAPPVSATYGYTAPSEMNFGTAAGGYAGMTDALLQQQMSFLRSDARGIASGYTQPGEPRGNFGTVTNAYGDPGAIAPFGDMTNPYTQLLNPPDFGTFSNTYAGPGTLAGFGSVTNPYQRMTPDALAAAIQDLRTADSAYVAPGEISRGTFTRPTDVMMYGPRVSEAEYNRRLVTEASNEFDPSGYWAGLGPGPPWGSVNRVPFTQGLQEGSDFGTTANQFSAPTVNPFGSMDPAAFQAITPEALNTAITGLQTAASDYTGPGTITPGTISGPGDLFETYGGPLGAAGFASRLPTEAVNPFNPAVLGPNPFGTMISTPFDRQMTFDFGAAANDFLAPGEREDFGSVTSGFTPDPAFNLGDVTSGYAAPTYGFDYAAPTDPTGPYSELGYTEATQDFGEWDQPTINKYVDPYMAAHQNLVDQQKDAATEAYQSTLVQNDAEAVARGSRGSYRQELVAQQAQDRYLDTMGDIEEQARASAWEFGQQQYEMDRKAAIVAAQMGDASAVTAANMRMRAFEKDREANVQQQRMQDASGLEQARMTMQADLANVESAGREFQLAGDVGIQAAGLGQAAERANIDAQRSAYQLQQEFGSRAAELGLRADEANIQSARAEDQMGLEERARYAELRSAAERGNIDARRAAAQMERDFGATAGEMDIRAQMANMERERAAVQMDIAERQRYIELTQAADQGNVEAGIEARRMQEEFGSRAAEMDLRADLENISMGRFGLELSTDERSRLAQYQQSAEQGNIEAGRMAEQLELEFGARSAELGIRSGQANIDSQRAYSQMSLDERSRYSELRTAAEMGSIDAMRSASQMELEFGATAGEMTMRAQLANMDRERAIIQMNNEEKSRFAELYQAADRGNAEAGLEARRMEEEFGARASEMQLRADLENLAMGRFGLEFGRGDQARYAELQQAAELGDIDATRSLRQMQEEFEARSAELGLAADRGTLDAAMGEVQFSLDDMSRYTQFQQAAEAGDIDAARSARQMEEEFSARSAALGIEGEQATIQSKIAASQMDIDDLSRYAELKLAADQGSVEAQRSVLGMQEQFQQASGEMQLQREGLNIQARQGEFDLLGRLGMGAAEGAFGAGQFNAANRLRAAELTNQYEAELGRLNLAASQGSVDAMIQAAQLNEQLAQIQGAQALDWERAGADTDLAAAEIRSREGQFLEQLRADIAGRNIEYDLQGRQLREQGLQEAGQQGLAALQTLSPLELEADRLGDDAAFRNAQLALAADQADREFAMQQGGAYAQQAGLGADLGQLYDQRQLNLLREFQRAGASRRELDQNVLDMAYETYMRRTNWAQDQLNWLQGIFAGAPAQQQQYTMAPGPSPISELLGLGLGASAIGNLFNNSGQQGT